MPKKLNVCLILMLLLAVAVTVGRSIFVSEEDSTYGEFPVGAYEVRAFFEQRTGS